LQNVGGSARAEQLQVLSREKAASKSATLGDLIKEKLGDKLQGLSNAAAKEDTNDKSE
jgi:hypothetical protein